MKRVLYLDIIRILACVMIIAIHAPIPNTGLSSYVLSIDSLLTAPGIGLFIMVSGALLLPVNMPTEQFLKKRLGKIVFPTVFWTVFYFLVALYTDRVNLSDGLLSFLSIPFSAQFNGVLWFMYMLAGLYLLAPIMSCWLRQASRREVEFYMCLWTIAMCYPLIRTYILVNEGYTGVLYYVSGYAGYFLLGYYLKSYVQTLPVWKCLFLIAIPVGVADVLKITHVEIDFYDLFGYLSIFVAMMATAIFMAIKNIPITYNGNSKFQGGLITLSNCCFGIYLVHIFVMRTVVWHIPYVYQLSGVLQIAVVTVLTFIGSLIITMLISHMPGAEYLIGFKQKR